LKQVQRYPAICITRNKREKGIVESVPASLLHSRKKLELVWQLQHPIALQMTVDQIT